MPGAPRLPSKVSRAVAKKVNTSRNVILSAVNKGINIHKSKNKGENIQSRGDSPPVKGKLESAKPAPRQNRIKKQSVHKNTSNASVHKNASNALKATENKAIAASAAKSAAKGAAKTGTSSETLVDPKFPLDPLHNLYGGKHGLLGSQEARRQLTAGHSLGKNLEPVAVLEEFFNDKDIYSSSYKDNQSLGSYVTPESPEVTGTIELRGTPGPVLQRAFSMQLLRSAPTRAQKNQYMMFYFPPWHPIALARKSRPALTVCFGEGAQYNGALSPAKAPSTGGTRNPFHFALWRGRTKRFFKRAFYDAWQSSENKRDGLYVVIARKVPTDYVKLRGELLGYLKKQCKTKDFKWVDAAMEKVNLRALNNQLAQRQVAQIVPYPREKWKGFD